MEVIEIIGVYLITNLKSQRVYIGESIDIYQRWERHKKDLVSNQHHNQALQNDYNLLGASYFKFTVLQEIDNTTQILITQSRLIMLENAYIEKFKSEKYNLYNVEETLLKVINKDKHLQIAKDIANDVVISNFLKYKYVFNHETKAFILKPRDTIENFLLKYSSIKSLDKAQKEGKVIFEYLKSKGIYEKFTVTSTYKISSHGKNQYKPIIELTPEGINYILQNLDLSKCSKRKDNPKYSGTVLCNSPKSKSKCNIAEIDKNKIQDVWHIFKNSNILPEDNSYNDFRNILNKLKLITISEENRRTYATEYALNNKFLIIYGFNKNKNIYKYYISQNGIDFIKDAIVTNSV